MMTSLLANLMLWLMYIVLAVAVVVTLLSVAKTLRLRSRDEDTVNGVPQSRIAWCVAGAFVLCMVITFLLGSSYPLAVNGVRFTDVFWLKVTDMFIYTTIILTVGCLAGVIVSRFRS